MALLHFVIAVVIVVVAVFVVIVRLKLEVKFEFDDLLIALKYCLYFDDVVDSLFYQTIPT